VFLKLSPFSLRQSPPFTVEHHHRNGDTFLGMLAPATFKKDAKRSAPKAGRRLACCGAATCRMNGGVVRSLGGLLVFSILYRISGLVLEVAMVEHVLHTANEKLVPTL